MGCAIVEVLVNLSSYVGTRKLKGNSRMKRIEKVSKSLDVAAHQQGIVQQTKEEIDFKALAGEIIAATLETGGKYLALCEFIREKQLAPKIVTKWLLDMGFCKSKASEINKVAQSPDAVFQKFKARLIGWRGVLEISRGTVKELAATYGGEGPKSEVSAEVKATIAELDKELEANEPAEAPDSEAALAGKSDAEKTEIRATAAKERAERQKAGRSIKGR